MLKPLVIATLATVAGCSSLPPILQRWAGLEVATTNLRREDGGESLLFSEDGFVEVQEKLNNTARVAWRVRGDWLEIDAANNGSFLKRMRAVAVTKERIVTESPTGERTFWQRDPVIVFIGPVKQRPGFYMP